MKSCLLLLLALSATALVSARIFHEDGPARSLQQLPTASAGATCPIGCNRDLGGCIQDATMAGLRCQKCLGNLLVNKVNGNCSCPAGKYSDVANNCMDCPKGSFCPGGDYSGAGSPDKTACPGNMTTIGKRSISNRACVQLPGFSYTIDATGTTVGAVQCPVDTYSPGLKKQRACVPCPTGFTTNGVVQATSPTQCLVPAGYYLKAPGQVAPCPKGEYKEQFGANGNCTKCAFGVTTPTEGSISVDNCTILMPGYYAAAMRGAIVTVTVICPQGYYCGGGIPAPDTPFNASAPSADGLTINKCPGDAWTIDVGAHGPPGFYYNGTTTLQCASGSYRADWKPANQSTSCISCGDKVNTARTDQVKVYDILDAKNTWMVAVTSSADDCYIMPGQGLYYTSTTATWRARNCDTNNYGVSNITYGLTPAPCRDCPTNMVAINNATYSNSALYYVNNTDQFGFAYGFTNVMACVTIDGYGYNGRVAQACSKGFYNAKNNYLDCQACRFGLTTADVGAGVVEADCGMAPGFGADAAGVIRECPIGTYNNETWQSSRVVPCTACPAGTTTQGTGSDKPEQCNLCLPGWGGIDCNQTCGGDTGALAGTYGPPGRSPTDPTNRECVACSTMTTGYSFQYNLMNDVVPVAAISKQNASSSVDCLSQYAQIYDGAWYIPVDTMTAGVNSTSGITSMAACLALCTGQSQCQFVTYDYVAQICYVRYAVTQVYVGAPVIGFKALPSGDVATSAWKLRTKNKVGGKAVSSGQYTFYQDPNALAVGNWTDAMGNRGQVAPANAASFTRWQDCLNACDDDVACAAFIIELKVDVTLRPGTCKLIYGRTIEGEFKRTMTRADINRLTDISGNLK